MASRILVTRSAPENAATGRRLEDAGLHALLEPLFALERLDADLPDFDALAFTSLNGVRIFAERTSRRDMQVFCVGARTAAAARDAGFADVASADGDVSALAAMIGARLPGGMRLLHAGNEDSRGHLAATLRAGGLVAQFRAIYRAAPVTGPGTELARHLDGETRFEAILAHSPRASSILAGFLSHAPTHAPIRVAAISQAAGEALKPFAERLSVAGTPDEPALLTALKIIL